MSRRLMVVAALAAIGGSAQTLPPLSSNASVYATGLDNPRGLKFGPDGALYVAEGGRGGIFGSGSLCKQVAAPIGPYTAGSTGRISRIGLAGARSTVVDGLPSSQTSKDSGSLISGVADVAFVGNQMYALISGGGCSHGVPSVPNGVIRVDMNRGTWVPFADLSAFLKANPVANPPDDDFEPDGTFYSMVTYIDRLFIVNPNSGEIDEVSAEGKVQRVVDISESHGHVVPTALTYHDGWYFGNLFLFPVHQGSANVYRLGDGKRVHVVVPEVTTVTGVAFDSKNRLYILEMSAAEGNPAPGQGKVLRREADGQLKEIATGLSFPTAMTFGPNGVLYVSNNGFGYPAGAGQVVAVKVPE
jgi:hypothetical protein